MTPPPQKLSAAQLAMLRGVRAGRGPTDHLVGRGRSAHGGAVGTRFSLTRRGLLDRDGEITPAGLVEVAKHDKSAPVT